MNLKELTDKALVSMALPAWLAEAGFFITFTAVTCHVYYQGGGQDPLLPVKLFVLLLIVIWYHYLKAIKEVFE